MKIKVTSEWKKALVQALTYPNSLTVRFFFVLFQNEAKRQNVDYNILSE